MANKMNSDLKDCKTNRKIYAPVTFPVTLPEFP